MVEGAPMRFPGGTFFQIRGFVLGLGRQVHQGTDGTLDACQSQNPGKQKCARDFPCSRFQYPQKIHGTFFSVVMAPAVPERSRAVPRSWQLQPFRKAVFSFASGRRTSFRSISREAVLKCSSAEAAPWLHVTVAVSGTLLRFPKFLCRPPANGKKESCRNGDAGFPVRKRVRFPLPGQSPFCCRWGTIPLGRYPFQAWRLRARRRKEPEGCRAVGRMLIAWRQCP